MPFPRRVADMYEYWEGPPPARSPRCQHWEERIAQGWRPNRRVLAMGYDERAEFFGVHLWESLHVLEPLLFGDR